MFQRPSQERLARKTPAPALSPTTGRPEDPDLALRQTRARADLAAFVKVFSVEPKRRLG
jgi:hypothetical protein